MTVSDKRIRIIIRLGILIALYIIQHSLLEMLGLASLGLNLLVIFAIFVALFEDLTNTLIIAFLVGIFEDIISGRNIGISVFALVVAVLVCYFLGTKTYKESFTLPIIAVFIGVFIFESMRVLLFAGLIDLWFGYSYTVTGVAWAVFLNTIIAPILYLPFYKMYNSTLFFSSVAKRSVNKSLYSAREDL